MKKYVIKTPRLLKALYQDCIWHINENTNSVYLTFDDGPHPDITSFVLEQLAKYEAKATFFCIGKNVELYPEMFKQILRDGHAVGNHTYNHLDGWKTENIDYYRNIRKASKLIPG
jgi:Predicted xylanase/chitin deacetylase